MAESKAPPCECFVHNKGNCFEAMKFISEYEKMLPASFEDIEGKFNDLMDEVMQLVSREVEDLVRIIDGNDIYDNSEVFSFLKDSIFNGFVDWYDKRWIEFRMNREKE